MRGTNFFDTIIIIKFIYMRVDMKITNDIYYIGVNDYTLDLFEGQYVVPNGMAYNSYIIYDKKIAVMDTVDAKFTLDWLSNIKKVINDKSPDYLIVQHVEPDHSASINDFMKEYPETKIVSSAKAFNIIKNFFGEDYINRRVIVKEGERIELGKHILNFVSAPMVHWPEVILTYDNYDKALFSADSFGKFGAIDIDEPWTPEARRYYIGIVGKYGAQVQTLLKKISKLNIEKICPLHGPVLSENINEHISSYNTWSLYEPESKGVFIAYTSVYGDTKRVVDMLAEKLKANKFEEVTINDLARCDLSSAIANAFKNEKIVLATTTYNADIFPFMKTFINGLIERNFQKRKVALIENGSWAPQAAKIMKNMLANSKDIILVDPIITIDSSIKEENKKQIEILANELCK